MKAHENAKESSQVSKARKKIQRQIAASEAKLNPAAINTMRQLLEKQIASRQVERIKLRDKKIKFFDENKHPAKIRSPMVLKIAKEIALDIAPKRQAKLRGRIRTIEEK